MEAKKKIFTKNFI